MSSGIVVDANVMNQFTQSLIRDQESPARFLINSIRVTHGFAVDKRGQIQQQWRDTCGIQYFGEWLIQGLKDGVVRMVDGVVAKEDRKKLYIDLGFPRGGYELTYVAVAVIAPPNYVVTEDIDFWEPKHKKSGEATKAAIKDGRSGRVYRFLTRKMGVQVGTIAQAISDFHFNGQQ